METAAPLALPLAPAPLIADHPGPGAGQSSRLRRGPGCLTKGLDHRLNSFLWLTAFTMVSQRQDPKA